MGISRREELAARMNEARDEQNEMILEANEFFNGDVHKQYIQKITEFYDRTVPNQVFEQVLGGIVTIAGNTATMMANNAKLIGEAAEAAAKNELAEAGLEK